MLPGFSRDPLQDISTDEVIMGLERAFARRGTPKYILSDNGRSFVKTDKMIKEFWSSSMKLALTNRRGIF